MMFKVKKKTAKLWLVCWIAFVSLMLVGLVTYAAYTNLNSVKRVVSTQGGRGSAFSSNYLNLTAMHADTFALKSISFSEGSNTAVFEINICNYVHNDPSKVNENDIIYSLTLTLVRPDGTTVTESFANLSVKDGDTQRVFSNGVCALPERKMTGGVKCVDTYVITVPKEFIDTVNIKAVAEPDRDSSQYTDNKKLGRVFTFSEYNAAVTTWTGNFVETTAEGYDAFNYVIKGQGKGTVILMWDDSNLQISNVFVNNNGIVIGDADGKKSFTMKVDSNVKSRYEIQFYKTKDGVYADMEAVKSYVGFDFSSG